MNCPKCSCDIDEHPANRCLDAWVAEEVMGLNIVSHNWRCGQMPDAGYEAAMYAEEPKYGWRFYNEEGPVYWEDVHDVGWGWPPWVDEDYGGLVACVEPVPFYSTDIVAAWGIVETFRCGWQGHAAACIDIKISDWASRPDCQVTIFAPDIVDVRAEAYSPCLAICRAALKVADKDNVDG